MFQNKVNIADDIPRYLQAETKLLTTQCIIIETEKLGPKLSRALHIVKQYHLHKCGHEGKPVPASACLMSMVKKRNEDHYIIATQDRELQERLRKRPGIPLLYFHQKTPVLEHPSEASMRATQIELLPESERAKIFQMKERHGIEEEVKTFRKKKKKGGPNPLSCKKKKKQVGGVQNAGVKKPTDVVDKKTRKKVRIPRHVKEQMKKLSANVS